MKGSDHRTENIALGVLAMIVAMIAIYALATNKGISEKEPELATLLPANYEPVLAALIRASGQRCDRICSTTIDEGVSDARVVRAACSIEAEADCAHPTVFEISVAAPSQPSR